MAVFFLEDMLGTVECIAWPRVDAENASVITEDSKVLLKGRVKADDEKDGQLMVDEIIPFEDLGGSLYIRFEDMESYREKEEELKSLLRNSEGRDRVIIFLNKEKKQKILPESRNVKADEELMGILKARFGEENIKYVG